MPRQRRTSNASGSSSADGGASSNLGAAGPSQELSSMYDYLAKIILLGPSGAGKSCVLHRFLRNEWRALSSQTIGVEFGSKIIALGTGARRTRIKLQLWDTAGTERFRAVSRSYYRGAAGALLIYDVASYSSFGGLSTFLRDARALASPKLSVVLVGNKVDVDMPEQGIVGDGQSLRSAGGGGGGWGDDGTTDTSRPSTSAASLNSKTSASSFTQADSDVWGSGSGVSEDDAWDRRTERGIDISSSRSVRTTASASSAASSSGIPLTPSSSSAGSIGSTSTVRHGYGQHSATRAPHGREVDGPTAARWASSQAIPVNMEVSALNGHGVDDAFRRLAQIILTKIELGEIDPDDPQSGIQYGDAGWWGGGGGGGGGGAPDSFDGFDDGGSSIRSGGTLRRRKGKGGKGRASGGPGGSGLREWEAVFRLDRRSTSRKRGCC